MLYYATASGPKVRDAMSAGLLGQIRTPAAGNALLPGVRWIADNGCYTSRGWTVLGWGRWLHSQPRTADWAAVPDVVGDHAGTLARWRRYAPWVRSIGFRPAFVAQDGCDAIPDDAAALFLGGSTDWKLSTAARDLVHEANRRGIPSHMGRVNSARRLRLAAWWGCDSVDGTYLAWGPDANLPKLLGWLDPPQAPLIGATS